MEKWEYQTIALETKVDGQGWFKGGTLNTQYFADQLNTYGMEGWELVGFFNLDDGIMCSTFDGIQMSAGTLFVLATFKRKL